MNAFDSAILGFLNPFVGQAPAFDQVVVMMASNGLLKGGVLAVVFWWAWFWKDGRHRESLLATIAACFGAIVAARALALALPMRLRPLHEEALDLVLPLGLPASKLDGWSSLPSDHAALFFALATGLCFISRRLGGAAIVYVSLVVALPRIYLSLHYPTDILAGAAIGVLLVCLAQLSLLRRHLVRPLLALGERQPAWSYPVLFFVTYQIADVFDSGRALAKMAVTAAQGAMGIHF